MARRLRPPSRTRFTDTSPRRREQIGVIKAVQRSSNLGLTRPRTWFDGGAKVVKGRSRRRVEGRRRDDQKKLVEDGATVDVK